MDFRAIRLTIRRKLESGRLPLERAAKVWGRSPSGEACDGCDQTIGTGQLAMDGLVRRPGRAAIQLHLRCFEIWAQERSSLLRRREPHTTRPLALGQEPA